MRRAALAILLLPCMVSVCGYVPRAEPPATAITNVTVLVTAANNAKDRQTVIIRGERIVEIGDADRVAVPKDADVIDGTGAFLIPGLIDMHAHAAVPRCDGRFDLDVSKRMLAALLSYGITTARSPATPPGYGVMLRDSARAGVIPAPRLFVAGEFINGGTVSPAAARDSVRDRLRENVDYIKVYAGLQPGAVSAAIQEAHARNVQVIGHLQRTTWLEAITLGIDHITHGASWSLDDLPVDRQAGYTRAIEEQGGMKARMYWLENIDLSTARWDSTLSALGSRRVSLDPTLIAYHTKFTSPTLPDYRANPARNIVPEMLDDWQRCGNRFTNDWTEADYERMRKAWPVLLRMVHKYYEAGILFTAGTDVTNAWVIPGESLHQELELLSSAGIPNDALLRIATRNGAEALGLLDDVGTIDVGKRADLILLSRDPRVDIRNTRSILRIFHNGRPVR